MARIFALPIESRYVMSIKITSQGSPKESYSITMVAVSPGDSGLFRILCTSSNNSAKMMFSCRSLATNIGSGRRAREIVVCGFLAGSAFSTGVSWDTGCGAEQGTKVLSCFVSRSRSIQKSTAFCTSSADKRNASPICSALFSSSDRRKRYNRTLSWASEAILIC